MMERLAQELVPASPSDRTAAMLGFVAWEEVFVSGNKGRREVHYYLKRHDGSSDLAEIGKERSFKNMYAICSRSLVSAGPFSSLPKLNSRREEKRRIQLFGLSNLRLSREWMQNGWVDVMGSPDLVCTLSSLEKQKVQAEASAVNQLNLSLVIQGNLAKMNLHIPILARKKYFLVPNEGNEFYFDTIEN